MKLTIKQLRTRPAYEIAKQLGLGYTGDSSPIPHGGTFYETNNWNEHGNFVERNPKLCEN
jgi:hypothetical protein